MILDCNCSVCAASRLLKEDLWKHHDVLEFTAPQEPTGECELCKMNLRVDTDVGLLDLTTMTAPIDQVLLLDEIKASKSSSDAVTEMTLACGHTQETGSCSEVGMDDVEPHCDPIPQDETEPDWEAFTVDYEEYFARRAHVSEFGAAVATEAEKLAADRSDKASMRPQT